MHGPLVSIVIPCFNTADCVADAIRSALDQTYPDKEVIVVDDGSTDDGLAIIRSFGSSIRWKTGPNRGACVARNLGLEMARGEFVQFLDADDILFPEKLAVTVATALETGAESVVSSVEQLGLDGTQSVWVPDASPDPVVASLGVGVGTAGHIHRADAVRKIGGFTEDLPCAQERDLHLRLACAGARLSKVSTVLALCRRRLGSLSSDSLRVLQQYGRILPPAYRTLLANGGMTDERAQGFAGFVARAGKRCWLAGDRETARQYFALAREFHRQAGIDQAYGGVARRMARAIGPEAMHVLASSLRIDRPKRALR